MKRTVLIALVALSCTSSIVWAQNPKKELRKLTQRVERLEKATMNQRRLSISGYLQGQTQYGQEQARLRVGEPSKEEGMPHRMGIRRGRIKFDYTERLAQMVFQLDVNESKVSLKDAYFELKSPWRSLRRSGLKLGVFNRPFGYEIEYSSSRRESPERSQIFNELFPGERDMGLMLSLSPNKGNALDFLKLEAGLFVGSGIHSELDNRRDFIGHLSGRGKLSEDLKLSAGVSYYHGFVQHTREQYFSMEVDGFKTHEVKAVGSSYALRQYFGVDAQLALSTSLGTTQLKGEYLWGQQPSRRGSFRSPNSNKLHIEPLYLRPFSGGYVMLVQGLGGLPVSAVLKYEWLDPNTQLSGDNLLPKGGSEADLSSQTLGMGLVWRMSKSLRLQAYYDFVHNERAQGLEGYETDRADNVLTLRIQYSF